MKITKSDRSERSTVVVKTKAQNTGSGASKWWDSGSKKELTEKVLSTAAFLKEQQQFRYRQAGIFSRLYGNMPLFNFVGNNFNKNSAANNLPIDRPTMNVVQSCIDTLTSRITQSRPRPVFLTDNGDYKQRNIAKQMNNFIMGEFYQTKLYEKAPLILRDACALGTGCIKKFRTTDDRVGFERTMLTELLVDPNDALYGEPRALIQFKLVDRDMAKAMFPKNPGMIENAEQAYPDASGESGRTASDQIMLVEGWHLRSSKKSSDGLHVVACTEGVLDEPNFEKDNFPFAFLHYSPRILGFWGQGLAEQLMGTQVEINKLLMTISNAINLVGVPRVFVEDGSKIVKAHLNNSIGSIVTYRGTKPIYEVAPCMPEEVYAQLQRLVQYAYQQSGVSALAASAQKPAGLNSGEAIRNYDDLQSDRFAALTKRYDNFFVDCAYLDIDEAVDIAKDTGSYSTVYPNKNGTREIDLPKIDLLSDPVIQCFDASSLPRDPAGRLEKVTEMAQSGMINIQEARRLLDYPDLEQVEKLANASEERILQILDQIVEDGKFTPPDPFMDLQLANQLCVQYINLYSSAKLEEEKAQKLRDFFTQVQALVQASQPQAPAGPVPQAVPQAPPTSPLLPNSPQ